jgi:hypothetical protein
VENNVKEKENSIREREEEGRKCTWDTTKERMRKDGENIKE